MTERIKSKLSQIGVGNVTTLWDLLIWRINETAWLVGHQTVNIRSGIGYPLDYAAAEVERLMD